MKKIITLILGCVSCGITAAQPAQSAYTLQQLKDSALQNNIAIRSVRHSIETASQQRKEAFTNYFPNISGTGLWFNANKGMAKTTINPSDVISPEMGASLSQMLPAEAMAALASPISISMMKNGTIAGITALQPIFAGGQIINGNRLAKVGEDVSRLQLQLSENEVEKQTEQYYWQIVSLQEKMKTVEAVETMLADIHKDVDVAVRAGVALRNDLLQVQLRQNEVESQKLKLQNGITIVRLLMTQYCGLNSDGWILTPPLTPPLQGRGMPTDSQERKASTDSQPSDMTQPLPATDIAQPLPATDIAQPLPAPVGEGLGVGSVAFLPEYQLLQKQVEANNLQRKMEIGKNLPSLAVGAGYNYHNLLDNDHTFGMIFATVSVPISDWWGGSHAIKRKKIAYQQAQEQLSDNAELLTIRMQKCLNDVTEAQQQIGIAQRSIEQADENLRLHRDFYRAGTTTMSDLLEAQLLYQQSCDKLTDAVADYQNKLLEYRQSIGQ